MKTIKKEDPNEGKGRVTLISTPEDVDEVVSIGKAVLRDSVDAFVDNEEDFRPLSNHPDVKLKAEKGEDESNEEPDESKTQTKRKSSDTTEREDSMLQGRNREDNGKRANISISTIEEIKRRKREARLSRSARKQQRQDRLMNEAMEREREYKERKAMEKMERQSERASRRTETSILYKDYDERLLKDVEDEISTSDYTIKSNESIKNETFSFAKDLFASLEDMPRLSELTLSSDESELGVRMDSLYSSKSINAGEDTGQFVDPLTGNPLDTPSTESIPILEYSEEEIVYEDDSFTFSIEDDEQDIIQARKKSFKSLQDYDEDREAALLNFKLSDMVMQGYSLYNEEEVAAILISRQVVTEFVNHLIQHVVNRAEDAASKAFISRRLDIHKLYNELKRCTEDHSIEKYRNTILNSKIIDYFRRIQVTRHFHQLNFEDEMRERRRYKDALIRLDNIRERAALTKRKCSDLMTGALMELQSVQYICHKLDDRLMALVHKTFSTKDSEQLEKMVERELNFLYNVRNELSDFRVYLISKNHNLARYDEKIGRLAAINDDVNMDTFIHVQNQCITLGRKLEEKTSTLDILHDQYYQELHMLAHIRERSSEISEQLQIVHTEYKTKHSHQLKLHEQLFRLKLERDNMRKELRNLTCQGGLLFHHGLMMDFDETVERILKLKTSVQKLKNGLQQSESRLDTLQTLRDRFGSK